MEIKERNLKCIHCLRDLIDQNEVTMDHILPRSWYPDNTPENLEKWKAPACFDCNNRLSKVEQELLLTLPLCINPTKAEASGMTKRALASLGVGVDVKTMDSDEYKHRRGKLAKIIANAKPFDGKSTPFPNFGVHEGFPANEHMTIKLPDVKAFADKVIRGIEYKIGDRYIEEPYSVNVYFREKNEITFVEELFKKVSIVERGPGFVIQRGYSNEDSGTVLMKVTIWGTFVIYGSILKR